MLNRIINIDPTNLSKEDKKILRLFLTDIEKKKIEMVEQDTNYPLQITNADGNTETIEIILSHSLSYRPIRNTWLNIDEPRYSVFDMDEEVEETHTGAFGKVQKILGTINPGSSTRELTYDNHIKRVIKIEKSKQIKKNNFSRVKKEASLLAEALYPHAKPVTIVDEEDDATSLLVMRELEGVPLFKLIFDDEGNYRNILSIAQCFTLTKNLLNALAYLHAKNIVHRDLKPDNIIVNPDTLEVHIIDFGSAVKEGQTGKKLDGTPEYMPLDLIGDLLKFEDKNTPKNERKAIKNTSAFIQKSADIYSIALMLADIWFQANPRRTVDNKKELTEHLTDSYGLQEELIVIGNVSLNDDDYNVNHSEITALMRKMMAFNPSNRPSIEEVYTLFDSLEIQSRKNSSSAIIEAHKLGSEVFHQLRNLAFNPPEDALSAIEKHIQSGLNKIEDSEEALYEFLRTINITALQNSTTKSAVARKIKKIITNFDYLTNELFEELGKIEQKINQLSAYSDAEMPNKNEIISELNALASEIDRTLNKQAKYEITLDVIDELNKKFESKESNIIDSHKILIGKANNAIMKAAGVTKYEEVATAVGKRTDDILLDKKETQGPTSLAAHLLKGLEKIGDSKEELDNFLKELNSHELQKAGFKTKESAASYIKGLMTTFKKLTKQLFKQHGKSIDFLETYKDVAFLNKTKLMSDLKKLKDETDSFLNSNLDYAVTIDSIAEISQRFAIKMAGLIKQQDTIFSAMVRNYTASAKLLKEDNNIYTEIMVGLEHEPESGLFSTHKNAIRDTLTRYLTNNHGASKQRQADILDIINLLKAENASDKEEELLKKIQGKLGRFTLARGFFGSSLRDSLNETIDSFSRPQRRR